MEEDNKSLAKSMQQTIEYGNFEFVEDIGEIMIDAVIKDEVLKEVPILSSIVGVGKCIKNMYDAYFAKKLIQFLIPLKVIKLEERKKAIEKWEQNENYRGNVGETLIGMIQRCDDSLKAKWLSKLFYEFVLLRNEPRLFMRAEKILSSLSVMDIQAFLNMDKAYYSNIREIDCEPYIGSGLYQNPKISNPKDGILDFGDTYCMVTEMGYYIYNFLNDLCVTDFKQVKLF